MINIITNRLVGYKYLKKEAQITEPLGRQEHLGILTNGLEIHCSEGLKCVIFILEQG